MPEEDPEELYPKVKVSEVVPGPQSRTRPRGRTRLNKSATALYKEVLNKHQKEPLWRWVMIRQGKWDGSMYMVPTEENDDDKLLLTWREAGREVSFSLNKVLKAKHQIITKGHCMVMDCYPATLPKFGAALELRYPTAHMELIDSADTPKLSDNKDSQASD